MLVQDVMTTKVFALHEDDSFSDIVSSLIANKISGAPVLDSRKNIVGILSEKDLLKKILPSNDRFYENLEFYFSHDHIEDESDRVLGLKAKDFMRKKIISISPEQHILRACALLLVHKIRRLPVVEKQELVGIVTTDDIYTNYLSLIANK